MSFSDFEQHLRFRQAWEAVEIARPVEYALFTFGGSELPYYLVVAPRTPQSQVAISRGEVRITRPLIITPDNFEPEFADFFDDDSDGLEAAAFFLKRTIALSNLKLQNRKGPAQIVTDSVEEAVARLNRQLDSEEEDRVAILCAPAALAGFAVFRYATERVIRSAPDNLRELRERGFLP